MVNDDRFLSRRAALRGAAGAAAVLGATAALSGTAAAAPAAESATQKSFWPGLRVPKDSISVQLYTLRSLLENDVDGTLSALADIGYRKVEMAGTYGRSAKEFRGLLRKHRLTATSSHIGIDGDVDAAIADAKTLGHTYAAVPYAAYETIAEWEDFADRLDTAARAFAKAGIKFGYHNHDHEFAAIDGVRPYDIITRRTSRRHVHLELDLFWVVDAGIDPVELYWRNFPRALQYHVKDRSTSGEWADPGTGTIDFKRIFRSTWFGIKEFVVEHDDPSDPLNTAVVGYNYLRDLRF
ncbi:sugar phosphate isomerase [Amycolatopsis antarctica]|uniref:Sugar phosphate isomerase n=1 Tax=Amycolatopsis antarctica TaxID=1854586 RepID=A0A263D150_9PSEU|nr:sugar phosphate isomerase/epimerase [Amycolatopsis antarctica]OZM71939.1 sugar phosphate isomerase [Amycolatopsis antarctica]